VAETGVLAEGLGADFQEETAAEAGRVFQEKAGVEPAIGIETETAARLSNIKRFATSADKLAKCLFVRLKENRFSAILAFRIKEKVKEEEKGEATDSRERVLTAIKLPEEVIFRAEPAREEMKK
jgi:hypothetical protein